LFEFEGIEGGFATWLCFRLLLVFGGEFRALMGFRPVVSGQYDRACAQNSIEQLGCAAAVQEYLGLIPCL
jgi:hypothetical protein